MVQGGVVEFTQAVNSLESVVVLLPTNGVDRAAALHMLTMTHLYRFDVSGRSVDLDAMVHCARQCVTSTGRQRVRYHASLIVLSNAVWMRHHHLHNIEDLKEFVSVAKNAVDHMPAHYPSIQASCIGNLGIAERRMYIVTGDLGQLNRAITNLHRSIDLRGGNWGRLELQGEYFELGEAYIARAEKTNAASDWNNGVQAHRQGLQYVPRGHARRTRALLAPAVGIRKQFLATGHGDIGESIQILREARSATSAGLPSRAQVLVEYGRTLALLYQRNHQQADRDNALDAYRSAAKDDASFVQDRYEAAVLWTELAKNQGDLHGAVDASAQAIALLPRLAWIGTSQDSRLQKLKRQAVDLGADAAAMAIEFGALEEALELLEASRTVFWTQLRGLRADSQGLHIAAPALASEIGEVGRAMEASDMELSFAMPAALARRRRSSERWDYLVREVRRLPGFERFLLPARFGLLRQAAYEVPIIVLNVSERRCDVLIITSTHRISHLALPSLTLQLAKDLYIVLAKAASTTTDRAGRLLKENAWIQVLERLWLVFGQPLVNTLARLYPSGPPSRVRLCPVGVASLLPLHAAMPRGTQQRGLPDLFCCSYTASISALLHPQPADDDTGMRRLLTVLVPSAPDQPLLASAKEEKRVIQQLRLETTSTVLEGAIATVQSVSSAIPAHDWLHIATHGKSVSSQPLESGLYLHDGPLTLAKIAELRLTRTRLAFLSGCHCARGSDKVPDECLHLAAGLQFAGVEGVVATMGEVSDKDVPEVARLLYSYMMRDGQVPKHEDAAEGLKRAIANLRRQNVPTSRWAPFIHVG
ncbi:hypothetical protein CALCODRAFT_431864 [Calocera cornea HHB12733]|uniref:CHAT domain-containing protein n=1 Tax=Calocera cornea HHB12733 TaxID=1353952 RepID=A0A165H4K5_9BASI|nr:hypothetical protein CALCODRAFT_431864 [Calocera cornea HHB12733]